MATATVLYVLKLGGDLAGKLPSLSAGLQRAGKAAVDAKNNVVAVGTAGRSGLNQLGGHAHTAAEGAFKAAAGFAALGFATHELLRHNEEYSQSIVRLANETQKLGQQISESLGPAVGGFIDRFTIGFVYMATVVGNLGGALKELMTVLIESGTIAANFFARMAAGDPAGADAYIRSQRERVLAIFETAKRGWADVNEANRRGVMAAFEVWKKITDGIADSYTTLDDKAKAAEARLLAIQKAGMGTIAGQSASQAAANQRAMQFSNVGVGSVAGQSERQAEAIEEQTTTTAEGFADVTKTIAGGATSILYAMGPIGAAIAAILDIMGNFKAIVEGASQMLYDSIVGFADQFDRVMSDLIPKILEQQDEIVVALSVLPFKLIESFITNLPEMAAAFAKAIGDLISGPLTDKRGRFLGLGPHTGGKDVRTMHGGGFVERDGLHNLERGEFVQSRQQVARGGGPSSVTIQVAGITSPDHFVRTTRARLGSLGVGLSLTPRTVG